MTPRELLAHERSADKARAPFLAALHNGAVLRKDKAFWTPDMFMPNHSPKAKPDESWKTMKAQLAQTRRKSSADDRAELHRQQMEYGQRASRAAAAQASGASREVVMALMEDFNAG